MANIISLVDISGNVSLIHEEIGGEWRIAGGFDTIPGRLNDDGTRMAIAQTNIGGYADSLRVAFFDISSATQIYQSNGQSSDSWYYREWDLCANSDFE